VTYSNVSAFSESSPTDQEVVLPTRVALVDEPLLEMPTSSAPMRPPLRAQYNVSAMRITLKEMTVTHAMQPAKYLRKVM
jgi:hypothetical protein